MTQSKGSPEKREHPSEVQHCEPRDQRYHANGPGCDRRISAGAKPHRALTDDELKREGVDPCEQQESNLPPPRRIVRVLFGMSDEKRDARGQIEQKSDHRERHQFARIVDWDLFEKSHQAQIEKSGDADDEREADEMNRLAQRPDPDLKND